MTCFSYRCTLGYDMQTASPPRRLASQGELHHWRDRKLEMTGAGCAAGVEAPARTVPGLEPIMDEGRAQLPKKVGPRTVLEEE